MNKNIKFLAALASQIVFLTFLIVIFTSDLFDIAGEKIFFIMFSALWFTNALTAHAGREVICDFIDKVNLFETLQHRPNYHKIIYVFIFFGSFFMLSAILA